MDEEIVSKTKRKREMHELQALGASLLDLPEALLHAMNLDAALLQAVLEAKRIKSHEAKRRQVQYIGRLMRRYSNRAGLIAVRPGVSTSMISPAIGA